MSGERAEGGERILELIEKFRQRGATSPDAALTLEELGLPPRFKYLVHRRQGRLRGGRLRRQGIFLEKDGKYYLSEERLRRLEGRRSALRRVTTM